ncbi:hypothetical protein ACFL27_04700 [candidate division CSSED10-310 bacterium]|uniref:AAA+ ATPase domain-containing protein n=1 Tax=candidate division CSSED10-310 bacterium TaxID=2855610 RepID=A0ABV6YTG9_UNCC1
MILLDPKYHSDRENIELDQKLLHTLPKPIHAIASTIDDYAQYKLRLQELCLSLIPLTFQYIALILSCEYFNTELPPKTEVTDSFMRMIKRPGPGKWVGFIRSATSYFKERSCQVIATDTIAMLHTTLVSRRKPKVTMIQPSGLKSKIDYYEALINIRNRFAHSRQISESSAAQLFADYYRIWKALVTLLQPLFTVRILRLDTTGGTYLPYDNAAFDPPLITPSETGKGPLIIINEQLAFLELKPLLVLLTMPEESQDDVLFLEEMKGNKLLYLYKDHYIKRKEEYASFIALIDSRTVPTTAVSSSELSVAILSQRIHRITQTTLTDFEDTLKYIPGMFVERASISRQLNEWLNAPQPGAIVVGEPGTGKTSLVANWCGQRNEQDDHVLLLEAAKLEHSDLPRMMESLLHLGSPLRECLENIYQENRNIPPDAPPVRFILIIDGVNEFVGSGLDNRSLLWQEISNLVNRFDDYRPFFKCLVTTRSDLWKQDFPKKDSLELRFKRRLFFGSSDSEFPLIYVGSLDPEEVVAVYEKARASVAGMAPLTPYQELTPTTQKVIRNPFLLRLLLRTYNHVKVPPLTEKTLMRQYAQEKALKDQQKREILFLMLERMAELKKTEISLTEFLPRKKEKKLLGKKKILDLEHIIYDPRSQSPYKKLLGEGLIEERTVSSNGETEERLAFAQEKITNMLDREHKEHLLKRSLRRFLYVVLIILLLLIPVVLKELKYASNWRMYIQNVLSDCTLSSTEVEGMQDKAITITNLYSYHLIGILFILFMAISLLYLLTITSIFIRRVSAKFVVQDLPTQYTNQKFARIRDKYLGWFFGIVIPLTFPIWRMTPMNFWTLRNLLLVMALISLLVIFASGGALLRHARTSEDTYTLLGKNAFVETGLNVSLVIIPMLILLFLLANLMALINSKYAATIQIMEKEFVTSSAFQYLEKSSEKNDRSVLVWFRTLLFEQWKNQRNILDNFILFFQQAVNKFTAAQFIIFPLFLVLQWVTAIPLEVYLRQRLTVPQD